MADKYLRSGAAGDGLGADWANAYLTLTLAFAGMAAGDRLFVAGDHSESTAGALTFTAPGTAAAPNYVLCANHAGTVPPVSADLLTTAIVANTGSNNGINFAGHVYYYGIDWRAGTGSNNNLVSFLPSAAGWLRFKNCRHTLVGTGTSRFIFGSATADLSSRMEFEDHIFKFASVANSLRPVGGRTIWRGGSVDGAGAIPTTLLTAGSASSPDFLLEAVDLSALGSGKTLVAAMNSGVYQFKDCKRDAAVTIAVTPLGPGPIIKVSRSSTTAVSYVERQYRYSGSEVATIGVVRTGGSTASQQIDTTANAKFILPYGALDAAIWNAVTGSNITVTQHGIANKAAIPKDDEAWFDLEYPGTSGNSLGVVKSSAKADVLAAGASLTATTEAWDTGATARANTTVYVAGDVIKVASNAGRVFFCTTGGTTAGSEPAGYASAVDGGSVTDDTAVFRAGFRFKMAVTTTAAPTIAGFVYAYPKIGVASTTLYLDRKLVLS